MKKVLLALISMSMFIPVFTDEFSFRGIAFGSEKGTFAAQKEFKIGELNFENVNYTYEDNKLVEVSAEISGKKESMIILSQLISVMKVKYELNQDSYLQSGGDIIQLYDKEMNMITVIIADVDNEDCDAKLEDAMIFFTSSKKKTVQDMKGL